MECETSTRRVAGVTLVTCRLTSDATRAARLENELDGPVWPPRRRGVPARGWDADGVAVTVDGPTGVGYACPAPPADPPVAVVAAEDGSAETESTPDSVVRALGDPRPPSDAVAVDDDGPPDGQDDGAQAHDRGTGMGTGSGVVTGRPVTAAPRNRSRSDRFGSEEPDERGIDADAAVAGGGGAGGADAEPPSSEDAQTAGSDAVEDWLSAVEARVDRLAAVADAESVPEATAALRRAGGVDGAAALRARVRRDREALAAVADRADRLDERAPEDVDLATLRRLA